MNLLNMINIIVRMAMCTATVALCAIHIIKNICGCDAIQILRQDMSSPDSMV